MRDRQGCLAGLLQLFLLDKLYDWLQKNIGFGRGGCIGTGCGCILLILMILFACGIIANTDWLKLF
ncbi:MAG: hypothetical protein AB1750_10000 [Chloroflexota bacterium]